MKSYQALMLEYISVLKGNKGRNEKEVADELISSLYSSKRENMAYKLKCIIHGENSKLKIKTNE